MKSSGWSKKGDIWISVIIYTLVAIVALALILSTGMPILSEIREKAVFSKVKDTMIDLVADSVGGLLFIIAWMIIKKPKFNN